MLQGHPILLALEDEGPTPLEKFCNYLPVDKLTFSEAVRTMWGSTEVFSVYSRRTEDVPDEYKKSSTNYKLFHDMTAEMDGWPHIPAWYTAVKEALVLPVCTPPAALDMIQLDLKAVIHQYIWFIMYFSILTRLILTQILFEFLDFIVQGVSNMTGTNLYVNKPHCAAAVRPWESEATTSTLPPARVRTCSVLSGSC